MLYQLSDGRVVEMSFKDYLDFSDEELRSLLGYNCGDHIHNPHYGSAIGKYKRSSDNENYSNRDISDVPPEEKIKDQDYVVDSE